MSNNAAGDSSSFSRAFLPGLILGLVVGGLCGAVLPDLLRGTGPAGVDHTKAVGEHPSTGPIEVDGVLVDRDGVPIDPATDPATDSATDAATDAAGTAQDAASTTTGGG